MNCDEICSSKKRILGKHCQYDINSCGELQAQIHQDKVKLKADYQEKVKITDICLQDVLPIEISEEASYLVTDYEPVVFIRPCWWIIPKATEQDSDTKFSRHSENILYHAGEKMSKKKILKNQSRHVAFSSTKKTRFTEGKSATRINSVKSEFDYAVKYNSDYEQVFTNAETFTKKRSLENLKAALASYQCLARCSNYGLADHCKNLNEPLFYKRPIFQQVLQEKCPYLHRGTALPCFREWHWKTRFDYRNNNKFQSNCMYYITELSKSSLLSYSIDKLSVAMLGICAVPNHLPEMLWRLGNHVLQSTAYGLAHISSFQNLMKYVVRVRHHSEAYMGVATRFLVNKADLNEAYQALTEVIAKDCFIDDIYLNILYGQIEYILWKLECNKNEIKQSHVNRQSGWGEDSDLSDGELEPENDARLMFHGNRAMNYLRHVEERMGIWDTILPKYCQLVTYFKGANETCNVLLKHLSNNPSNPCAYRLLYDHLIRNEIEQITSRDVLEQLSEIDPTSDLCKDLILHYVKTGCHAKLFDLLVQRLDHSKLRSSSFDWQHFHDLATKRDQLPDIRFKLQELISARPTWLRLHFSLPPLTVGFTDTVLEWKAHLAQTFDVGKYSSSVREWLESRRLENVALPGIAERRRIYIGRQNDVEDGSFSDLSSLQLTSDESHNDSDIEQATNSFDGVQPDLKVNYWLNVCNFENAVTNEVEYPCVTTQNGQHLNNTTVTMQQRKRRRASSSSSLSSLSSSSLLPEVRSGKNKKRPVLKRRRVKLEYDTVSLPSSSSNNS